MSRLLFLFPRPNLFRAFSAPGRGLGRDLGLPRFARSAQAVVCRAFIAGMFASSQSDLHQRPARTALAKSARVARYLTLRPSSSLSSVKSVESVSRLLLLFPSSEFLLRFQRSGPWVGACPGPPSLRSVNPGYGLARFQRWNVRPVPKRPAPGLSPNGPPKAAKGAGYRTHRRTPQNFVECGESRYPGASPLSLAVRTRYPPERPLPKRRRSQGFAPIAPLLLSHP